MKALHKFMLIGCVATALTSGNAAYSADRSYDAAQQSQGWYTGLSGDATWLRHSDTGGGGNLALGYKFAPDGLGNIRLEGEIGYHYAGGENGAGSTQYFTYMANGYYDFSRLNLASGSNWSLVPYVGAGLGDATVHFGDSGFNAASSTFGHFSHHDNVFAYQFMAGLTLTPVSAPNTDWSLGYRFLDTDSSSYLDNAGNRGSDRLHANNAELGFRYHF